MTAALALVALLAAAYALAASRTPRPWSRWRTAAWLAGCSTVAVALLLPESGGPRTHMAQHLLLGMVAPIGLVLAAPITLLLRVSSR